MLRTPSPPRKNVFRARELVMFGSRIVVAGRFQTKSAAAPDVASAAASHSKKRRKAFGIVGPDGHVAPLCRARWVMDRQTSGKCARGTTDTRSTCTRHANYKDVVLEALPKLEEGGWRLKHGRAARERRRVCASQCSIANLVRLQWSKAGPMANPWSHFDQTLSCLRHFRREAWRLKLCASELTGIASSVRLRGLVRRQCWSASSGQRAA